MSERYELLWPTSRRRNWMADPSCQLVCFKVMFGLLFCVFPWLLGSCCCLPGVLAVHFCVWTMRVALARLETSESDGRSVVSARVLWIDVRSVVLRFSLAFGLLQLLLCVLAVPFCVWKMRVALARFEASELDGRSVVSACGLKSDVR